jgi:hypothetical protein
MKHQLEIDAWMGALKWTPETAESCVVDLCAYLKNKPVVWIHFAPYISAGLRCLVDNPDELYRLALHVYNESPNGGRKLLAMILASVDAALPERLVQEAIRTGALMSILVNKNYTIAQRLSWLKENPAYLFVQGGVGSYEASLETPIKDALMLYFFMSAAKGGISGFHWRSVGLTASEAADKQFLQTRAPGIAEQIDIVRALDLTFANAVDMLIDTCDGKWAAPVLDLPSLSETHKA